MNGEVSETSLYHFCLIHKSTFLETAAFLFNFNQWNLEIVLENVLSAILNFDSLTPRSKLTNDHDRCVLSVKAACILYA